nr:MAG TPA: hypothetical protein [Caudoviricetes sp.]
MTEKKLTEARRLAEKILPKVQKMQRDIYFNNHVSVCIEFYGSSYSFYVDVYSTSDKKGESRDCRVVTFRFYDFYDAEENDKTFERLVEYVKKESAA